MEDHVIDQITTLISEIVCDGVLNTNDIPRIIHMLALAPELAQLSFSEIQQAVTEAILEDIPQQDQELVQGLIETSFQLLKLTARAAKSRRFFCCAVKN